MRKLILLGLVTASALAVAAPAEAQPWRRRDRGTVIIEQQPAVNTSTLAVILAIQAAKRAAEAERRNTVRDASREYVPLK